MTEAVEQVSQKDVDQLRKIILHVEGDENLKQKFCTDPTLYILSNGGRDIPICLGNENKLFSEIISSVDVTARVPVARTLIRKLTYGVRDGESKPEGIPAILGFAVANVLIVGNAVVMFNAVANAQIKTNVNGSTSTNIEDLGISRLSASLGDDYLHGEVFKQLDKRGLSPIRQAAILRNLIVDQLRLGNDKGGYATCAYDGISMRVHFTQSSNNLIIVSAEDIDAEISK